MVISLPSVWAGPIIGRREWPPVALVEDRAHARNVVAEEPRDMAVDVSVAMVTDVRTAASLSLVAGCWSANSTAPFSSGRTRLSGTGSKGRPAPLAAVISGKSQRRMELGQKTATGEVHHQVPEFLGVPDLPVVCNARVVGCPAPRLSNVFQRGVQVDRDVQIDVGECAGENSPGPSVDVPSVVVLRIRAHPDMGILRHFTAFEHFEVDGLTSPTGSGTLPPRWREPSPWLSPTQ